MKTLLKFVPAALGLFMIACASQKTEDGILSTLFASPDDGNRSIVVVQLAENNVDYTGDCYDTFTIGGSSNTTLSPTNYYNVVMFGHSLDTERRKSALSKSTCSALGFLGSGVPTNGSTVNFKMYTCDPNLGQGGGACGTKILSAVGF
ncbi:hypothetical protein EHQ53_15900 [Leptospira langatensis]|uniref:Lipoprotein n=1 Tax=Leptospira langatensis TaxID=2484983 RepID=A0A5F1ZN90_9LEPT|nr:hypothetical protein [Leptospira langatensis]TGK05129.1 hypothetical protein EHO57_00140 [Leptospira langatensis]TGL38265.1 hypothetical protein EHQ53_15900 [Leptospira langatensis]